MRVEKSYSTEPNRNRSDAEDGLRRDGSAELLNASGLTAGMVESALGTEEFAFAAQQFFAAVDTILPIMVL